MPKCIDPTRVTGVLLAGGLGKRLRAVIADRQKTLADVNGRPFIFYLLQQLETIGIERVVLCTGYLGEQVANTVGAHYGDIDIEYSFESEPLGTGGALRLAMTHIASEYLLVLNGDSYCHADLCDFWKWHLAKSSLASIMAVNVANVSRYGHLTVRESLIESFNEKGTSNETGLINAGIYLLHRSLVLSIQENACVSLERELFPQWIPKGLHVRSVSAPFIDIGTPESLNEAGQIFNALSRIT